jgi:hypothetical protein
MNKYRIDGWCECEYAKDGDAMESAQGWTDGPGVVKLEKWIDGRWCRWDMFADGWVDDDLKKKVAEYS